VRIALVGHLPDFPGPFASSRRVELLARGLVERGHAVTVIIPRKLASGPMEENLDGIHIRWCYDSRGSNTVAGRVVARWRAWQWLMAALKRNDIEWVFFYNVGIEGLPMAISARFRKCRVGAIYGDVRFHPGEKTLEDRVRLAFLETADVILPRLSHLNIMDTRFLEAKLRKIAPHTPTLIVPPLVDPSVFRYNAEAARRFRRDWGLEGHVLVGYLGSFWIVNGVANLLRAVRILVERGKKVRLLVAGRPAQGLDCDDVPLLIKELDLEQSVVFPGMLDTQDVVAALSACDILTIPRVPHVANEAGSPTKLAEYLSVGRPVVAAAVGDIPLYLQDGADALLVEPGDVDSLVAALESLVDDEGLRIALAYAGRKTADQVFDYRKAASRIESAMVSASA
jgi:glycosyltransferase involved in cell wall biosynthesis